MFICLNVDIYYTSKFGLSDNTSTLSFLFSKDIPTFKSNPFNVNMTSNSIEEFEMDALNIIATIILCIGYFIYTPLILYYWNKFNKTKNEQMFRYRSPILVNIFNAVSLSTLIIYETYICLGRVFGLFACPLWSFYLVIGTNWWCALGLFATKTYLLFYNQKYNMAVVNSVWQKNINASKLNWYIAHKSTFGSVSWILTRIFLPFYIFSVSILTILPSLLIENKHNMIIMHFVNTLIISVPLVFGYVIAWKAKDIIDAYGIRNEMVSQCFFVALSLTLYFITFVSLEIAKTSSNSMTITRFEWCSYMFIGHILICGLTMSTTYYPIYLFNYKRAHGISTSLFECDDQSIDSRSNVIPSLNRRSSISVSAPSMHIEYSSSTKNKTDKGIKTKYANCLQTVLRSSKGLSLFMQHLVCIPSFSHLPIIIII